MSDRPAVAVIGKNVVIACGTEDDATVLFHELQDRLAVESALRRHLDFCAGGGFCSLDDCLCECHVA